MYKDSDGKTKVKAWDIRLSQTGLSLQAGKKYKLKFKITSTAGRKVKYTFLDSTYASYGSMELPLSAGVETEVDYILDLSEKTSVPALDLLIDLGTFMQYDSAGHETEDYVPASRSIITLSDFSLIEIIE